MLTTSPARPERAIESRTQDKLGRGAFVRRLVDALVDPLAGTATGITIGIDGPWGSGKTSILNLLHERLLETKKRVIVVRFNPWLISGRNDLVTEFLNDVIRAIVSQSTIPKHLKEVARLLAEYGEGLGIAIDAYKPGLGRAFRGFCKFLNKLISRKPSLHETRDRLLAAIGKIETPIIVLIDEIDRVEDSEIQAIAQLVRSVMDLPKISYVLAYDSTRVIQALGGSRATNQVRERGRAYLEKIVQLQIPLPEIFDEEISELLSAALDELQAELELPRPFQTIERYQALISLIVPKFVRTPRDVRRLMGTYHALAGMLRKEVDWIDLLAYSTLLTKSPSTAEAIRMRPLELVVDAVTEVGLVRRMSGKTDSDEDRFKTYVPAGNSTHIVKLLAFLFPAQVSAADLRRDALCRRRPLLVALRLGVPPGEFSRPEAEELLKSDSGEVASNLARAMEKNRLPQLIERLQDIYLDTDGIDNLKFWTGVSLFLSKSDGSWMSSYSDMHMHSRRHAELLGLLVSLNSSFKNSAVQIYRHLCERQDISLISHWLRQHFYVHGIFGARKEGIITFT